MAKQTYTTGQVLTAAQMTALQANDYNWTVSAKTASYVLVAADAGTRITMSNVGATTITVNTALFTAGDTLTITNIGAGACTITAGTATVSTAGSLVLNQYDSGTLYFSSTSAAIWNGANPGDITGVTAGTGISGGGTSGTVTVTNSMATEITAAGDIIVGTGSGTFDNLPIGTTAQVLTADTTVSPYKVKWATPASGGMTLLATTTLTGASVTISSLSTYKQLLFVFRGARVTSNSSVELRFNGDTANNYSCQEFKVVNTTISSGGGWVGAGSGLMTRMGDSATTVNLYQGNLVVNATDQTSGVSYFCTGGFNDGTGNTSTLITGRYANIAVISSITLLAVGTTFASGTVLTYGVN